MKLQDYACHYIGCNVGTAEVVIGKLVGIDIEATGNTYYVKTKKFRTVEKADELLWNNDIGILKLHLRQLENMTEEEGVEMFGVDRYWDIVCKEGMWDLFSSKEFHYLLSKGFDLFGLIPAGLAIDIKTIDQ